MINNSWAIYVIIIIAVLCVSMLAFILSAAVFLKPYRSTDTLKYFEPDFLTRAAEYNRAALFSSIAERFIFWVLIFGIIALIWKQAFAATRMPVLAACALFAAFNIIIYVLLLPIQYYRGFVLEHKFGLSNQTISAWFIDLLKDRAISLFINTLVLTVLYLLIIYMPRHWWVLAAGIFIVFVIIANFIFPVLIDPLFHKFTPLDNKKLESGIVEMTQKSGIKIDSILVADASRRTSRVNAYFTGIGATKRIVIYDNLLANNTDDEVLAVIAHEIGHVKYKHITISIIIGSAAIAALLLLLKFIHSSLNIGNGPRLIILIFILFSLISYLAIPVQNFVSRQFEKQADKTAIELTENTSAIISIFANIAKSNLSNVDPGPLLKYTIYSHPPIIERIKRAEEAKFPG